MLEFNSKAFYEAMSLLNTLSATFEAKIPKEAIEKWQVVDPKLPALLLNDISELRPSLEILGARLAALSVDRFNEKLRDEKFTYKEMFNLIEQIHSRVTDELSLISLFVIEDGKLNFFHPATPLFGPVVDIKFPRLIDEIVEAGKCYALDRPTASVFHSIRCLEGGIHAISKCLNIPDPSRGSDRNWSNVQKKISAAIASKWPSAIDRFSGDGKLFEEIVATLAAIQNPYRNATMHLNSKYTLEEALHIFEMVKGLMARIAARMDENGLPLA